MYNEVEKRNRQYIIRLKNKLWLFTIYKALVVLRIVYTYNPFIIIYQTIAVGYSLSKKYRGIKVIEPRKIRYGPVTPSKFRYLERLHNDINFRLGHNLRSRFYNAIKRCTEKSSVLILLGCDISFLKQHLAQQFQPGMTWDNYGEWEIDHIISLCNFQNTPSDLKKAWNYKNLQPLWKHENRKKPRLIKHF